MLALALALSLAAQPGAPPCGGVFTGEPPPELFFEHPVLVSPQAGEQLAPLNVEMLLGGLLDRLELDAPTWQLRLVADDGSDVPLDRVGARVRPTEPLLPETTYTFWVEPTQAHGCPDCVAPWTSSFRTATEALTEPPGAAEVLRVGAFVDDTCGGVPGVVVDLDLPPRASRVEVAVQRAGDQPRLAVQGNLLTQPTSRLFGAEGAVSGLDTFPGEELLIAVSVLDLAGNVSPALIRRTQVQDLGLSTTEGPTCELPLAPHVRSAAAHPSGSDLVVDFAFAPQAVALRRGSGEQLPLDIVETEGNTVVLRPAGDVEVGEAVELVALPCERCLCRGCGGFPPVSVSIAAADDVPPSPPRIHGIVRDLTPAMKEGGGQCVDDLPALVVHLDVPPDDDVVGYRGTVRALGFPGLLLESWADFVDDGDVREVRFDALGMAAELEQTLELQLTAIDAAGLESTSAITAPLVETPPSCAAYHPVGESTPTGLALVAGCALAFVRRRR
jgi:hypothetical protein